MRLNHRKILLGALLVTIMLLNGGCSFADALAPQPTANVRAPTRTPRPTATPLPTDTATPTDTPTATATIIPAATSTFTALPPSATFTRLPPTRTFTPRPPTATFTSAAPTGTATSAFPMTFNWINPGRAFDANECGWPNGTHIQGMLRRPDGSVITGAFRTAAMHLSIKGDSGGPFAYPGLYRDFPNWNDGRWDAELPRRAQDFEWHIYISAKSSDEPISSDLMGMSAGVDKCGQPGTKNYFVVDWIAR